MKDDESSPSKSKRPRSSTAASRPAQASLDLSVDGAGQGDEAVLSEQGSLPGKAGSASKPAQSSRELIRVVDSFIDELGPDAGYARKPVEAILVRPSEGRLTVQARRWYNVLLRNAQLNEPEPGQRVRMSLKRFYRDARQEKADNEYLAEVLNLLVTTPIQWGDSPGKLEGKRYKWSSATLLSYASISKDKGEVELVYDFDREVKAMMLQPEVYAKISLEVIARVTTHAALFLYELGMRYYMPKGELSSKELPWKDWVLPVTGSKKVNTEKLLYKIFVRDTLKPALTEINDDMLNLPFNIRAETRKVGRKVEGLRFTVTPKRRNAKQVELGTSEGIQLEVEHLSLIGRLITLGVPQAEAMKLYNTFGHEKLRGALEAVERRRTGEPIENPVNYFRKVLKTATTSDHVLDVESRPVAAASTKLPSAPGAPSLSTALSKKYQAVHREETIGLFEESPEDMKQEEYERFETEGLATCGAAVQREWTAFRKKGRGAKLSALVRRPFFEWLVKDAQLPSDAELQAWGLERGYVKLNIE